MLLSLCALVVAGVWVFGWGWKRAREAHRFSVPRLVHTYGGTNYVFRLSDVTVGRTPSGFVVIVAAQLENPNRFPVELHRDWFVLVDSDRDYYQPSTNGTQTARLTLPAGGVLERELFSYQVPGDGLDGVLAILAGHQHWVMVKSPRRYVSKLREGEFVTRHRVDW